jgi:tRNA dimethylallyltransferase
MSSPQTDLIAVVGPTAAGKSTRAMALAEQMGGEIVSADSRHVYRRMDIGTNKPTPEEQQKIRHHLLNLREPDEDFTLADYVILARCAIEDVRARGRVPLLVGGTGQYVRALLQGWQVPAVPPNDALRERWSAFAREHGEDALYAELLRRDPGATFIDKRNVQRVVRALEVMEATGRRWSDLQRRVPPDLNVEMIYVNLPREELYARADARLMTMIESGWLDEARALLDYFASRGLGGWAALNVPAMSALGYREITRVALGEMRLDDAITEIKRATRRFIRMQDAWFRKDIADAHFITTGI